MVGLCCEVGSRNGVMEELLPELVLPRTSSQDFPLGYAGNDLPLESWTVFKEAWIRASIKSHIFETGTPISEANAAPDSQNDFSPRPA